MLLPDDPDFAPYANLPGSTQARHPEVGSCFICEGRFLVEEALAAAHAGQLRLLSILVTESAASDYAHTLPSGTRLLALPNPVLQDLVGFSFHRGVLACACIPEEVPEVDLIACDRLLVLPHVDYVDNLGLLLRSAAALGMDAVLTGTGPGPFDRRTVRVSMGAAWKIPVIRRERSEDLLNLLERWRGHRTRGEIIAAALVPGALDARDWRPSARNALLLGSEGSGLGPPWLDLADRVVMIPMARDVDSLNVAAAGAILMWNMLHGNAQRR